MLFLVLCYGSNSQTLGRARRLKLGPGAGEEQELCAPPPPGGTVSSSLSSENFGGSSLNSLDHKSPRTELLHNSVWGKTITACMTLTDHDPEVLEA